MVIFDIRRQRIITSNYKLRYRVISTMHNDVSQHPRRAYNPQTILASHTHLNHHDTKLLARGLRITARWHLILRESWKSVSAWLFPRHKRRLRSFFYVIHVLMQLKSDTQHTSSIIVTYRAIWTEFAQFIIFDLPQKTTRNIWSIIEIAHFFSHTYEIIIRTNNFTFEEENFLNSLIQFNLH